jgi:hypothetical protein
MQFFLHQNKKRYKMKKNTQLLQQAAAEITGLRKENNLMAARLDVFDSMMLLFKTPPAYPGFGMGEDVLYKIEKHIKEEEKNEQEPE